MLPKNVVGFVRRLPHFVIALCSDAFVSCVGSSFLGRPVPCVFVCVSSAAASLRAESRDVALANIDSDEKILYAETPTLLEGNLTTFVVLIISTTLFIIEVGLWFADSLRCVQRRASSVARTMAPAPQVSRATKP